MMGVFVEDMIDVWETGESKCSVCNDGVMDE